MKNKLYEDLIYLSVSFIVLLNIGWIHEFNHALACIMVNGRIISFQYGLMICSNYHWFMRVAGSGFSFVIGSAFALSKKKFLNFIALPLVFDLPLNIIGDNRINDFEFLPTSVQAVIAVVGIVVCVYCIAKVLSWVKLSEDTV